MLPICTASNAASGTNGALYCRLFGAFRLVNQHSNQEAYAFLGRAQLTSGIGGDEAPDPNEARVVKLVL